MTNYHPDETEICPRCGNDVSMHSGYEVRYHDDSEFVTNVVDAECCHVHYECCVAMDVILGRWADEAQGEKK